MKVYFLGDVLKKKIWIFVVPVLLFVMSVVLLSFRTEAFAEPNLKTSAYFSGAGTEESPYIISNVDHFVHLAADVGAGIDYRGEYFILDGDIDFEGQTLIPIGNEENPFRGTFDGSGYTISNIVIDGTNTQKLGLFGACENATIKNLGVSNIEISSLDVVTDETSFALGGICAVVTNSEISQCFVKNADEKMFEVNTSKRAYVGGIVGMLAGSSRMSDCFSNTKMIVRNSGVSPIDIHVGGLVGFSNNSHILNSYSAGNIVCGNLVAENGESRIFAGGILGFVQGAYSSMKNCFCLGDVSTETNRATDKIFLGAVVGGISGNASQTPNAGNLNFCHYLQNETTNNGRSAVASNITYNLTGLVFKAQKDVVFFQRTTQFEDSNSYDLSDGFDFDEVWLIEKDYPELQLFAYYDIEIEQADHLTITVSGGEPVPDKTNTYKFKAGQMVSINAVIDEGVEKFYHVQTWRRNQTDINSTAGLLSYEFPCSYLTQGKYSVVIKENTFTLKIVIPNEFSSISSIRFESSLVGSSTFQTQLPYGREISVEAVLGTSENAQNYAFAGWFSGSDAENRIDWDSSVLNFKIGDAIVPFDNDLTIVLAPKYTRDICRLNVAFDSTMGKIRLYETDEFSDGQISNKPIKKGQFLNLEAECLEGYEFLGWFRDKSDLDPITKSAKLSGYEIKDDTQSLYAKFQQIGNEEEAKKGLDGWAIFGIVAGCLAAVGITVLIIVLVKKKGSYKSSWNF